ncbi:MAG: hypothetical protein A2020_13900 [Lentisphaerae bacterium GWF2_45_14]|nr:MAG: hypothetical protein A2020_13900 [Lentisphaerae bacterium GWF2_45_14]
MKSLELREINFFRPDREKLECLSRLCPVVTICGNSIRSKWHVGERKTFNHLWVFIGSGEGIFKVDGIEFPVKENDFVWVPPDTLHEMRGTSETMHCIYAHIDLLFDSGRSRLFRVPGGVRDLAEWSKFMHPQFGDDYIDSLCGLIPLANPLQVKMLFEELCRIHKINPEMTLKLAGLIIQILGEVLASKHEKSLTDIKLEKALVFIHGSLYSNLDVVSLAKSIGLSSSYFRSLFKNRFGKGPVALHRELRIRKACELLTFEGLNVSETGSVTGFSCIQSFSRTFKEVMRISPKKFMEDR